jgi:Ubiquitin carboxyl-terminal hydrolase
MHTAAELLQKLLDKCTEAMITRGYSKEDASFFHTLSAINTDYIHTHATSGKTKKGEGSSTPIFTISATRVGGMMETIARMVNEYDSRNFSWDGSGDKDTSAPALAKNKRERSLFHTVQVQFEVKSPLFFVELNRSPLDGQGDKKTLGKCKFPQVFPTSSLNPFNGGLKEALYDLDIVVVHTGGVNSGHYWCYKRMQASRAWYRFDDSSVRESSWQEVESDGFGCNGTTAAHLLVYTRRSERVSLKK